MKRAYLIFIAVSSILVATAFFMGACKGKGSNQHPTAAHESNQSENMAGMPGMENTPESQPAQPKQETTKKVIYRCPMHPQYTSDRPGKCPICGMDLVKDKDAPPETHPATRETATQNMPKGFGMVQLPAEKIQLIGIRTTPVTRGSITRTIRAPATVKPDERKIKQAQSKVQGWIERRYVNYTGQYVKRGQPLLSIYSPDLVSTQEEYLLALRNSKSLEGAETSVRQGAEALTNAARRRLKYWDISDAQIQKLEQTGTPSKTMTLFSPVSGYVTQMTATEGMEVQPGMALYSIVDLSDVWVMAGVYEQDIGLIANGMQAVFHAESYPGRDFVGKVSYINPQLDPQSRTAMVRIELPNPDMVLRPEMYGEVTLVKEITDALVMPASAVMDNGEVKVVYVQTDPGHFMPRRVKVGIRTNDQVQILDGLVEGELVVVDGNFLLDSESRLRAAAQGAGGGMEGMQH